MRINLLLFIVYSSAYPVLHSFPTRRSSDLPPVVCLSAIKIIGFPLDGTCIVPYVTPSDSNSNFSASESAGPSKRYPIRSDRKSTRLNSSHVAISYAVFCLKKKIQKLKKTK